MSHDIPPFLRAWLDETLAEAPHPDRVTEAVAAAIHQTPQQRGWLPPLGTGRSKMFAAITSIAAAVTLAVAGGLLFTAQEPDATSSVGAPASASPAPSASSDPMGAAWVTGTLGSGTGGQVGSPEVSVEEGVTRSYPYHWQDFAQMHMSDPRLGGMLSVIYNQDTYDGAEGDLSAFTVVSGTYRIENEAGSWEGPNIVLNRGSSGTDTVSDTGVLVGSGAYEGLTAFLVFDFSQGPTTVVGAIFPGEMPPMATFE
jgi:hypothetical protein